jgi:hypothetical protein
MDKFGSTITIDTKKKWLLSTIDELSVEVMTDDTQIKFFNLFRSRLMECGIPSQDALLLALRANVDLHGIEEDDDFIGDVASALAEKYKKVYDKVVALYLGFHIASPDVSQLFDGLRGLKL